MSSLILFSLARASLHFRMGLIDLLPFLSLKCWSLSDIVSIPTGIKAFQSLSFTMIKPRTCEETEKMQQTKKSKNVKLETQKIAAERVDVRYNLQKTENVMSFGIFTFPDKKSSSTLML